MKKSMMKVENIALGFEGSKDYKGIPVGYLVNKGYSAFEVEGWIFCYVDTIEMGRSWGRLWFVRDATGKERIFLGDYFNPANWPDHIPAEVLDKACELMSVVRPAKPVVNIDHIAETFVSFVGSIDFDLLKVQKQDLLTVIGNTAEQGLKDSLEGLLYLIDAFQDAVEEAGLKTGDELFRPEIERLAKEFSENLTAAVGVPVIMEINAKNKGAAGACASHDYIDSNVCMSEAFEVVMSREIDLQTEEDTDLWNNAWQLAKDNGFYISISDIIGSMDVPVSPLGINWEENLLGDLNEIIYLVELANKGKGAKDGYIIVNHPETFVAEVLTMDSNWHIPTAIELCKNLISANIVRGSITPAIEDSFALMMKTHDDLMNEADTAK